MQPARGWAKYRAAVQRRYFLAIAVLAGMAACARAHRDPSVTASNATEGAASAANLGPDVGAATATTTAGKLERADHVEGVEIISFGVQAPIFSAPEWPAKDPTKTDEQRLGVVRLGYLRRGEKAIAKPATIAKANCVEGWYELAAAHAFICGKFVTTDPQHKELKWAPHAPYMDRNLPYEYGLNLTPGTPLYRRIPLKSERRDNEKTLALGKGVKSSDIAKRLQESGESLPAYLKDTGTAKATVSLGELKGESDLIAQRMLKGFYLALDRPVDARSGLFWHTASGFLAPKDHLIVHEPKTEFDGVVLDGAATAPGSDDKRRLPFAFVVGTRARQTELDPTDKVDGVKRGDKIERFSILNLTGKHEALFDRVYHETDKGFWVRDIDIAVVRLPKVPADIAPGEKWVDVDLTSQALVAFEGTKPVYATIVSTGRHNADAEKDHRTAEGSFRIREKHISTNMDGDGASDGTYSIEDVPWVMYFEKSLALHGAFWHSGFGRERSHGCVNLTPHDAKHIFGWAGPNLPAGWHGVRATKENPGTRVIVHR